MSGASPFTRRLTAIGLLAAPLIVALGAFAIWAVSYWSEASIRIHDAQERIHAAEARTIQISGYALLQDAWTEFSATPASGLILTENEIEAEEAVSARARNVFASVGGSLNHYAPLAIRREPGLARHGAELRGELPADQLPVFLAALESGAPRLLLDMIDAQPRDEKSLKVVLRASAFRLTDGEAPR